MPNHNIRFGYKAPDNWWNRKRKDREQSPAIKAPFIRHGIRSRLPFTLSHICNSNNGGKATRPTWLQITFFTNQFWESIFLPISKSHARKTFLYHVLSVFSGEPVFVYLWHRVTNNTSLRSSIVGNIGYHLWNGILSYIAPLGDPLFRLTSVGHCFGPERVRKISAGYVILDIHVDITQCNPRRVLASRNIIWVSIFQNWENETPARCFRLCPRW